MRQTLVVPDPLAALSRLDGVPSAVAAARDAVDVVLRDRGLRAVSAEQSAEALLAGARASAELSADAGRWLAGSVRLATELVALSSLVLTAPGQVVARAHALLAYGQVPDDELGKLRPGADVSRVSGLNALLTTPTSESGLLLAAVAHAELASVRPFGAGDGIIARAVEHMVLIATGVDPRAVIVPQAGHLAMQDDYRHALKDYAGGTLTGVRAWLIHCTRAVMRGAEVSPCARLPR